MTTEQHGSITEDGRIVFYAHHLSEENRQKVANVKAVYDENEALKNRIEELESEAEVISTEFEGELWKGIRCVLLNDCGWSADFFPATADDAIQGVREEMRHRDNDVVRLKARIAELEAEREWKPIEDAPTEPSGVIPAGLRLLLFHPKYGAGSGHFDKRWHLHFCLDNEAQPTHFMHMPKMEDE